MQQIPVCGRKRSNNTSDKSAAYMLAMSGIYYKGLWLVVRQYFFENHFLLDICERPCFL